MGKVVLVVVDSLGLGAMDDVGYKRPEDFGANTLLHVLENNEKLKIPILEKLGLFNALGYNFHTYTKSQCCTYGICSLGYEGADSYLGHNEIMGISSNSYGNHELSYFIDKIRNKLLQYGYKIEVIAENQACCLLVNDTIIIGDNLEGDKGQLYTVIGAKGCDKSDLKFIASMVREEVDIPRISLCSCDVTVEELKRCIQVVDNKYMGIRVALCSLYNRNYSTKYLIKHISKEEQRKDNSCSILQKLPEKNIQLTFIGKVCDFVEGNNVQKYNEKDTKIISDIALQEMKTLDSKLIFINFQETDNAGHLCDPKLYGKALEKVDEAIGNIINNMNEEDLLIVTADHGNDPCIGHSRHTRETVPILLYDGIQNNKGVKCIGCQKDLSCINEFILDYFND